MWWFVVFFFNDTATTEIYTYLHTLSLHDALPIFAGRADREADDVVAQEQPVGGAAHQPEQRQVRRQAARRSDAFWQADVGVHDRPAVARHREAGQQEIGRAHV